MAEPASMLAAGLGRHCRNAVPRPAEAGAARLWAGVASGSRGLRDLRRLLYILEDRGDLQYFYLARARSWSASAADRSGPEFTDPTRGQYQLQLIPLTAEAVEGIDLKPDALAQFLPDLPARGIDLFALPDLRASQPTRI